MSKGRKTRQGLETIVAAKPTSPLTRASTTKSSHYYIRVDYSMKFFHVFISFIFFLNRVGFSSILPRKFGTISTNN
jgi:hypothetical protein